MSLDPLGDLVTLNGHIHFDDANSTPELYGIVNVTTGDLSTLRNAGIDLAGTAVLRFNTTDQDISDSLVLTGDTKATPFTLPANR